MKIITNISEIENLLSLPENSNLENRLLYFNPNLFKNSLSIFLVNKTEIIGWISYSQGENDCLHLGSISIDPNHQSKGGLTILIDFLISLAKDKKVGISVGRLTSDGRTKLKPKLKEKCLQENILLTFTHYRDQN